jgi:hypothetical protein
MNEMRQPQPWERALSAQHEIIAFASSDFGRRYFRMWLEDREGKYGHMTASTSASAFVNCLEDMMAAEPVYITAEMQELVYGAMETFNGREKVVEEDFFLRSAFVFLEEPFITIDQQGKRVAWRAISWHLEEMTFTSVRTEEEYREIVRRNMIANDEIEVALKMGIRFIMWSSVDDEDDYSTTFDEIDRKTRWLVAHSMTVPMEDISEIVDTTGENESSTLLFLRVMNKLMGERLVTRSRYRAARSLRRHSQKINLPISEITVVELRRKTQASEPTGETRNYSHRFIVHGFWRRQWYPSLGMHRQKYIADYVKGPDDKPLIIKRRIWNWDR